MILCAELDVLDFQVVSKSLRLVIHTTFMTQFLVTASFFQQPGRTILKHFQLSCKANTLTVLYRFVADVYIYEVVLKATDVIGVMFLAMGEHIKIKPDMFEMYIHHPDNE